MIAQADTIAISGLIYVASQFGLTSVLERYTNRRDAVLAASKLVGGLHAMIVGGSALLVITQSKWQNNDLINTSSSDGDRVIATEAGYMIGGESYDRRSDKRYHFSPAPSKATERSSPISSSDRTSHHLFKPSIAVSQGGRAGMGKRNFLCDFFHCGLGDVR